MDTLARRLRGLLGIGASWGALWAVIGAGIGAVLTLLGGGTGLMLEWALGMGAYGVVSGVGFGALLSLGEGRKTLLELSVGKSALLGVLGAGLVPLLFGAMGFFEVGTTVADVVGAMGVTAFLGGTFSATSVAAAQRAEVTSGEPVEQLGSGEA